MNPQHTPDLHKRHWLLAAGGALAAVTLAACSPSPALTSSASAA